MLGDYENRMILGKNIWEFPVWNSHKRIMESKWSGWILNYYIFWITSVIADYEIATMSHLTNCINCVGEFCAIVRIEQFQNII